MRFSRKYIVTALFFFTVLCKGQDNTVFITSDTYKPKEKEPYEGRIYYTQVGFSIPITVDDEEDEDPYYENDNDSSFWDQFTFDGLSLNAGAGIHFKRWAAIGVNSGIDARISSKLVAVPVYGTLTLNPHFGGESSLLLQYGYGYAFALGRGDLSGAYTKYKLGIHIDEYILVYLDATTIDLPVNNYEKVKSFSVGIDLMNFL